MGCIHCHLILRCQYILPQLPALLLMNYSAYGLLDVHEAFTFSTFMTFSFKIFTHFQNLSKKFFKNGYVFRNHFFLFSEMKKGSEIFSSHCLKIVFDSKNAMSSILITHPMMTVQKVCQLKLVAPCCRGIFQKSVASCFSE